MTTHVRRPSPAPFASNGRRKGEEGRPPAPGTNRKALNGMGEFILEQVRFDFEPRPISLGSIAEA